MDTWSLDQTLFAVFVGTFSLAAVWCDTRTRKIPNALTLPMFALGWVYQGWFFGLDGLLSAALAFAVGFGTLFLLWLMGSGGGGDVKLMGALAVWLGLTPTILVLVFSTVLVLLGTVVTVGAHLLRRGFTRTVQRYSRSKTTVATEGDERVNRRVMAFAIPVALATWVLMLTKLPPL